MTWSFVLITSICVVVIIGTLLFGRRVEIEEKSKQRQELGGVWIYDKSGNLIDQKTRFQRNSSL